MQETEQVIQAYILTLMLAAMSVFASSHPYFCILLAGLLLVMVTLRSLTERTGRLVLAMQICLSVAFVLFSEGVWPCLIFYECRILKQRWPQIFLPAFVFCVNQVVRDDMPLPWIIFFAMTLTGIALLIYVVECLINSYLSAKSKNDKAVSVAAVNEMYEKKLNRELMIKNYLADKNARLEERETISRNIHNSVGHSITAAIMTLDAADMLFEKDPEKAREKLSIANRRMRSGLDTIRHAVRVLDKENEHIAAGDFLQELSDLADNFMMDTTAQIYQDYADLPGSLRVPREYTEFLTGAVQELLTNGVRHGGADSFQIMLTGDSGHICLVVKDNGRSSFSEQNCEERIRNGFGLKKLIAYVERCGGKATFTNRNGFRSEITLPLEMSVISSEEVTEGAQQFRE